MDVSFPDLFNVLGERFKPYKKNFKSFTQLPQEGIPRDDVLKILKSISAIEEPRWRNGFVSGAVYNEGDEHVSFTNEAYSLVSQNNPLHPDVWPSSIKFEEEIISMTSRMLGGGDQTTGSVTSGGTESILLAMRTYRDWSRDRRHVTEPEVVLPMSAHAAFDKACQYFDIRPRWVPLDSSYKADGGAVKDAVNEKTIAITKMSEIAYERQIGFHVDACLGGFVLPWARKLGYPVPDFDFSLRGVTSMSVDTHKYGYAPKGTSVVIYRSSDFIRYQHYVSTKWPGGIYYSTTTAGSRPGGLIAAAWAVMLLMGENGYLENTRKILEAADTIREGVKRIPELKVIGDSLWVIAFTSETLNIYQVMERMSSKGWILNGLHKPPAVHFAVTLRHTRKEVADRFIADLQESVRYVKEHPTEESGMAPVYGMAATYPEESASEILKSVLEWMYKP
jgi:sphinganine-1-phosphate aldolase